LLVACGAGSSIVPRYSGGDGGSLLLDGGQAGSDSGTSVMDAGASRDSGASGLCSPCVASKDCPQGAFCLGGISPRCGQACASSACRAPATCDSIRAGKQPFGMSCTPSDALCGAYSTDPALKCADTWDNYAQAFFVNSCVGTCHRHDTSYLSAALVAGSADSIRLMVESGAMPVGQALSDAEQQRLLNWLACGAK
jgi:hypothetical protein